MNRSLSYIFSVFFIFYIFGSGIIVKFLQNFVEADRIGSIVNQLFLLPSLIFALFIIRFNFKKFVDVARANFLLIIFVTWLSLSYFWAGFPELTAKRVFGEWIVIIFSISMVTQIKSPAKFFKSIIYVTLFVIFLNIIYFILFPIDSVNIDGYFKGIYYHKNQAGTMFSIFSMIVICYCAFTNIGFVKTTALFMIYLTCVGLMILCGSKTNWGLYAITSIIFLSSFLVHKSRYFSILSLVIATLFCALIGWVVLYFLNVSLPDIFAALTGDPTLTGRTTLWNALNHMIAQKPILGFGWGSFWDVGEKLNPFPVGYAPWIYNSDLINHGHNAYIDIWVQSGIIGFILMIIVILRGIWVGCCLLNSNFPSRNEKVIFFCNLYVMTFLSFNGLTESFLFSPSSGSSRFFIYMFVFNEFWWLALRKKASGAAAQREPASVSRALARGI